MASVAAAAAAATLAPALACRRRARPGTGLLPPRRAAPAPVRCSLDSNVSDMGVNGEATGSFLLLIWSVVIFPPLLSWDEELSILVQSPTL
jgi:hypothetical protein